MMPAKKLKPKDLRWKCDPAFLSFYKDSKKFKGTQSIVGQDRAHRALETGLKLYRSGYNIYVAGMAGTGRTTTIRRTLEEFKPRCDDVPDRCYVYNFIDPAQPVLLTFARGCGGKFRDDMKELVKVLRANLPKTLESTHVAREREQIVERYQSQEKKLFEQFAEMLKKEGFALIQVQEATYVAPTVFPVINNEAVSIDYLENLVKEGKLSEEERQGKITRHKELSNELKSVLTKARGIGKRMHDELEKFHQRWALLVLDGLMDDLYLRYDDPKVRVYFDEVRKHVLNNLDVFFGRETQPQAGVIMIGPQGKPDDPFWYYEVNLLIEHHEEKNGKQKCPIIEEPNPSYVNLFGAVEYSPSAGGAWTTDFRNIKAGSLLQADGGYLIINALDLLRRPMVWDQLKRVLKTEQLIIQQPESYFQIAAMALKPEPIKLSVKVILIGPDWLYRLLWQYEEEFAKTFKILADFDTSMPLTKSGVRDFAAVMKAVLDRGEHLQLEPSGLAAMIEHGVEESGQRDRISTRFTHIADVLREAEHVAREKNAKNIQREHVTKALEERRYRHSLSEERVQRLIDEGVLLVDTRGKKVGQINGLAVYSLGHSRFGKPSRITAVTSVGKSGIINIEREAGLSGPTHDKGILILSGYLRHKYAQRKPLTLSASIAFEQSYGGVDGDSASSTEVYALLSSLSGFPLDQGFAVTGSVNQLGDIQPIGGVNEKIEGFFDVCKAQGFTGKQGVLIPIQNERHLMLRKDIVEMVQKGKFHLYSVKTIDEGIEVLTGQKAKRVHGRVQHRLEEMARLLDGSGETEKKVEKPDRKGEPKPPSIPRTKTKRKK